MSRSLRLVLKSLVYRVEIKKKEEKVEIVIILYSMYYFSYMNYESFVIL